ncbi:MAG: OPT/YSL family transporter, partial [Polyangiaceae bacterium]|nr:OPT/YSL family transporter [Polyangiaceae bacterium]
MTEGESRAEAERSPAPAYRELTFAGMALGIVVGVVMTASMAYAGLVIGFVVPASAIAAILGWGLLRGVLRRGTIVENNLNQTVASAINTAAADRNHSRHRWENQPAVRVGLEDLDHEEILRTRQTAIEQRRLSAGTSMDVGDILDRLGLRIDGEITQAAQMLYGTRFLPDYPQGLLKLGRFRGTKITGDILDNKQEQMHAFAMVREAMAWLDRTLPLSARFPKGSIFREDRLPVPAEALREVILNAVMHRDCSRA